MEIDCKLCGSNVKRMAVQERVVRINLHVSKVLTRYKSLPDIIDNTNDPATFERSMRERKQLRKQLTLLRDKLNNALKG